MDDLEKLAEIYQCNNCEKYFHRDDMHTRLDSTGKGNLYCNPCGDFLRDIKNLSKSIADYDRTEKADIEEWKQKKYDPALDEQDEEGNLFAKITENS